MPNLKQIFIAIAVSIMMGIGIDMVFGKSWMMGLMFLPLAFVFGFDWKKCKTH